MSHRQEYFDQLYETSEDPWNYHDSDYERAKYDATLQALPRPHYTSGIEVGCSVGILSGKLAPLCKDFLAVDLSEQAIKLARDNNPDLPAYIFQRCVIPLQWPSKPYDLIVLSEILYYLKPDELQELAQHIARDCMAHGHCLIVYWHGKTDTQFSGEAAATYFKEALKNFCEWQQIALHSTAQYTIVLWEKI